MNKTKHAEDTKHIKHFIYDVPCIIVHSNHSLYIICNAYGSANKTLQRHQWTRLNAPKTPNTSNTNYILWTVHHHAQQSQLIHDMQCLWQCKYNTSNTQMNKTEHTESTKHIKHKLYITYRASSCTAITAYTSYAMLMAVQIKDFKHTNEQDWTHPMYQTHQIHIIYYVVCIIMHSNHTLYILCNAYGHANKPLQTHKWTRLNTQNTKHIKQKNIYIMYCRSWCTAIIAYTSYANAFAMQIK